MKYISTLIAIVFATTALAQKPAKVFDDVFSGMDSKTQVDIDNNFNKARINFDKILLKDPENAMAHMGQAVVYSYDKYSMKDYFKAWQHFQKAEAAVDAFTADDKEVLNTYFFKQKKERRGNPLNKNMAIEHNLVEEKLIKFVREENNIEYAEKFLEEFPKSKYYNNVVHIRNYIEFRTAENAGTVEAFNAFLKKYPESAQVKVATEERDLLAFNKAQEANTYAAFKDFVDNYPDAIQYEEAKKKLGILAYTEAEKKHTLAAIEEFIANFPNSPKMPEAKLLKRQLLFEWAKQVNSIEAYNKFVEQYPEGEMFVDIFNLKSAALGQSIAKELPADNYKVVRAFDNKNSRDHGGSIAAFGNGMVQVIANTPSANDDMDDVWMIKLDAEGKMIKNDIIGNDFIDHVNTMKINGAGAIYAAGYTNGIVKGVAGQSWLFKMNAQAKNELNAKFEGREVTAMVVYEDDKVLLGGYAQDGDTAQPTPLLVKLNAQGRKLWNRTYAPGHKVTNMALAGDNCSMAFGNNWAAQIDQLGYLKWDNLCDEGCQLSAVAISNGTSVYTGTKGGAGYAIAFTADGKKAWEATFELPAGGQFTQSCTMPDGSVISGGTFGNAMVLVKIDANGKVAFVKNINAAKQLAFNGMAANTDNSVWISATYNDADILVLKLGL